MRIFASLMPVYYKDLPRSIASLNQCIDGFHVDIMDDTYVPFCAGSLDLVSYLRSLSELPLWIHLMVHNPMPWIERLDCGPGGIISIHYEAYIDDLAGLLHALVAIRAKGAQSSLVVSPDTSIEVVAGLVDYVDQLLIMGVIPGKSGQAMLQGTRNRLEELYRLRQEVDAPFLIGLDGGVSVESLAALSSCLPDDLAAATSIVFATAPCEVVNALRAVAKKAAI